MSLTAITCPYCAAPMVCTETMLYHISKRCQSEEHKAKQAEYDMGIIHDWKCKDAVKMIPLPKLVARIPESN